MVQSGGLGCATVATATAAAAAAQLSMRRDACVKCALIIFHFSLHCALSQSPWRALKYSRNDVNVACCPAIFYVSVPHEEQRHLSISVGHFSFRFQVHSSKFMSDPRH